MDQAQAEKVIKNAWTAGIISGVLTLIVTIIAMAGYSFMGFSAWNLLDVALIGGLTFGIYRKSRACAVIMFIYFIGSKLMMWAETKSVAGLPMALILGWYFYQGINGTFAWHSLTPAGARPAPQTANPGTIPKFKTREEYQVWKEQRAAGMVTSAPAASLASTGAGTSTGVPVWVWAVIVVTIGSAVVLTMTGSDRFAPGGAPAAWQELSSPEGNFAVLMPGSPTQEKKSTATAMGPIDMHLFTVESKNDAYIVMYSDYPEAILKAPAEKVLEGGRDGALANTKGKLISDQSMSLDGFPGREITIEIPGKGIMKLRVFLVRQRLFQVIALGPRERMEHEDTGKYLTSFRLLTR